MEIVCSMKAQRLWKKASPTPFPVPFLIIPRIVEEICANSILCSGLRRFGRLSCSFPDPFLSGAGNSPILGKNRECRPTSNKIPVFFPCSQERPPVIAVTTSWDRGSENKGAALIVPHLRRFTSGFSFVENLRFPPPFSLQTGRATSPGTPLYHLGHREPVSLLFPGGSSLCSSWRSICAGDFSTS